MRINVITLFPDAVSDFLSWGVVGQAMKHKIFQVNTVNPRDFTEDVHKSVDDRPYGGGDGMIMRAEPLKKAVDSLGEYAGTRVYLSPHGELWNDGLAREFACQFKTSNLTLICGRYGGVDQRFINSEVDRVVSVGDYVLSGGEIAALAMIDSIARFLPGVLGNEKSKETDSFANGLLEAPQFTRPPTVLGQNVPTVLRGGDHKSIDAFRAALGLAVSRERRPDLLASDDDRLWREMCEILRTVPAEELRTCGLSAESVNSIYSSSKGL